MYNINREKKTRVKQPYLAIAQLVAGASNAPVPLLGNAPS